MDLWGFKPLGPENTARSVNYFLVMLVNDLSVVGSDSGNLASTLQPTCHIASRGFEVLGSAIVEGDMLVILDKCLF